jgi:drug/metabolite transporter (DMT)-like permease
MVSVYLKLLFTAVCWGGTFIAGRVVAKDVGPFSAAFLRFAVAAILLMLITWKRQGRLHPLGKRQFISVILLGMTGVFAYNVFFFKGLKLIHAGRASLIIANNPVFIALFAALFFKERLNFMRAAGIATSVIGAIIVISRGHLSEIVGGNLGIGELYIFCCVAAWVAYSLIGKSVMTDLSPLSSVSYSSMFGAAALFIPAYFEGVTKNLFQYSAVDWVAILYLGVFGTVVGFVWYYEGIKAIGPTKAGQFINFVPVSAVLLAFFILGEPVTLSLLTGGIFVVSGVYLTNTSPVTRSD